MLDLSSPLWGELSHAYGHAKDIPGWIAQLHAAPPESIWMFQDWDAEPLASLGNALVHQSCVYTASYAALPHLVAITAAQPLPNRIICLSIIGYIAIGQREKGAPDIPSQLQSAYTVALEQAAQAIFECLQLDWPDDDYKVLLSALVAVRGHGSLAQAILFS